MKLSDKVKYAEMKKVTLFMNDKRQMHLIMQSESKLQSQNLDTGVLQDWVGDNRQMVKLLHVHGPGNTLYYVDRTASGDKICLLQLK